MQNLAVVSGKPCWQTQYMIARANKSGVFQSRITWASEGAGETLKVTASAKLADSGEVVSIAVSMAMAKADGWVKNAKYQSMPEHMLRWRSAAMLIRLYAPEVMLGIQSAEEVEDQSAQVARDVTPLRSAEAALPSSPRPSGPPRLGQPKGTAPVGAEKEEKPDSEAEACVAQFEADVQHARSEQDIEECAAIVAPLEEADRLSRPQRQRVEAAMEAARARIPAEAKASEPVVEEAEIIEEEEPVDPNDADFQRGARAKREGQTRCVIAAIREDENRLRKWRAGFESVEAEG